MYKKTLTTKEFNELYEKNLGINFFKHIDRFTSENSDSRFDFYKFFGINKKYIKADNGVNYEIPKNAAPLLAAMIKSFLSSYAYTGGNKSTSKNKKNSKSVATSFSYEDYHDYIKLFRQEIDKLEPYQQALITNYRSYLNAIIIDELIPVFLDRITLFLYTMFAYGYDDNSDYFFAAIDIMEQSIDEIVKRRLDFSQNVDKGHLGGEYTFENAIGETFKFLCDINETPSIDCIFSPELIKEIGNALEEVENSDISINEHLNNTVKEYFKRNQDQIEIIMNNISVEKQRLQNFWDAKHRIGVVWDMLISEYNSNIFDVIDICSCTDLKNAENYDNFVSYVKSGMIIAFEEDDWDDFDRWRNILDKSKLYEDLINEFFELQPMTYEQRQSFIEDHINYYNTSMKEYRDSQIKRNIELEKERGFEGSEQNIRHYQFYQDARNSELFKSIREDANKMIAKLLPTKLK